MAGGRVLFVDNNTAFLRTRKEFLEGEGYTVLISSSAEKAKAILVDTWLHIAIVNLRLTDDTGDRDISGLTLIRDTDPVIPKIILTAYPSWETVRKALGLVVEGLPPAVDFVSKQDSPEAMLTAVEKAFVKNVKINFQTDIQFQEPFSLPSIVNMLDESGINNELIMKRADEMHDLFRKLFSGHNRIILRNCTQNSEGVVSIKIRAFSARGIDQFSMKCGLRKDISAAIIKSNQREIYYAETLHYSAVVYGMNILQLIIDFLPKAGEGVDFLGKVIAGIRKFFTP